MSLILSHREDTRGQEGEWPSRKQKVTSLIPYIDRVQVTLNPLIGLIGAIVVPV